MEKNIRNAIVTVLQNLGIFEAVYTSEVSEYAGYPVAIVSPSDNDSDYGSTEADKVTFSFKIRIIYLIKKGSDQNGVDDKMYDLSESILNAFKTRGALGNVCDWIQPVPSIWGTEDRGEGVLRTREFTIKCKKYVSNT